MECAVDAAPSEVLNGSAALLRVICALAHTTQFGRYIFVLFTIHIAISVCLPLFFLAAATFFCQPFDLWELLLSLLCCNFVLEFYVCNVWSI